MKSELEYFSHSTIGAMVAFLLSALGLAAIAGAQEAPGCRGGAVESGTTMSDQLWDRPCDYSFEGRSGDIVTVAMDAHSRGLDPVLRLLNPDGREEAFDDDGGDRGNALIRRHRLRATGRYVIRAESSGAARGRFALRFSLDTAAGATPQDRPTAGQAVELGPGVQTIDPAIGRVFPSFGQPPSVCSEGVIGAGQPITATLPADSRCAYSFEGLAGDKIKLALHRLDAGAGLTLRLVAPDGRTEATGEAHGGGDRVIWDHMLRASGRYRVVVGPAQRAGRHDSVRFGAASTRSSTAAPFRLSLRFLERRPARLPAGCGGTVELARSGTFGMEATVFARLSPGDVCAYALESMPTHSVTVTMTSLEGDIAPSLELGGPRGERAQGTVIDGESTVQVPRGQPGRYKILAGSSGNRGGGVFKLFFEAHSATFYVQPCAGGMLPVGQQVSGTLSGGCDFHFAGEAGDAVTLRMNADEGGGDPVLFLLDPDGQEEAYDDDGGGNGNSLIAGHRLLRSGRYTVRAGSYGGTAGTFFNLLLEVDPAP